MSAAAAPTPIPFNKPGVTGRELPYLQQALASGHLSGDGPFTRRCHTLLEALTGAPKVLLTTSCTHALEMAALLADLGPGDDVLCPAFTFVSSVNAFALRGARPVFVDIRPDTLNIDERLVEAAITPRTRALMVVHYAGVGCEMPALMAVAARHGLQVIEDNAHGLFGAYAGRAARHLRRDLDPELPRDQEPHLRRGRRARHQRSGAHRPGRGPAREGHQSQPLLPRRRSTSTPGSTSAPATCPRTCWRPTSAPSSSRGKRSRRPATPSGGATTRPWPRGPRPPAWAGRRCRRTALIRRTCTT